MKNTFLKKYSKGFTLIELLVVIAIIGILTAIITSNFTSAKSKARDAKRVSDIAQLQLTLEQVFDKCNSYPSFPNLDLTTDVCPGYNLGYFISNIPKDPTYTTTPYEYTPGNSGLDYVLRAILENKTQALVDDTDGTVLGKDCNDDVEPYYYCAQPK